VAQDLLIEYIENVLDTESIEWRLENFSTRVKVAQIRGRPIAQSGTCITIGISHYLLHLGGGKETRQELVLCAYGKSEIERLVTFLLVFSEFLIKEHNALRRGQVIFRPEKLLPESQIEAVYTIAPQRLGNCFAGFQESTLGIEFMGLVPLHASEVDYVKEFGKNRFERLFESHGTSFLDLQRDPWI
jgi:hypothetical protein